MPLFSSMALNYCIQGECQIVNTPQPSESTSRNTQLPEIYLNLLKRTLSKTFLKILISAMGEYMFVLSLLPLFFQMSRSIATLHSAGTT